VDTAPRSGCPINAAVEVLGDPWAMLVLRDLMFGNRRHFRELALGSEEGIATNILASRLKRLVAAGLLTRSEARRGQRAAYSLTEAGIQVLPVMVALGNWGPLGIRHAGPTAAAALSRALHSLDAIMAADAETLTAVDGVGPVIAESLQAWFTVPTNRALIEKLRSAGVLLEGPEPETPDLEPTLAGKTFVLTGGPETGSRESAHPSEGGHEGDEDPAGEAQADQVDAAGPGGADAEGRQQETGEGGQVQDELERVGGYVPHHVDLTA